MLFIYELEVEEAYRRKNRDAADDRARSRSPARAGSARLRLTESDNDAANVLYESLGGSGATR